MNYKLEFTKHKDKDFKHIEKSEINKLKKLIQELVMNSKPQNSPLLKGEHFNLFRLKKGNYRVIYEFE